MILLNLKERAERPCLQRDDGRIEEKERGKQAKERLAK